MISKPKEYSYDNGNVKLGGYLLNDVKYISPLIRKKTQLASESVILNSNLNSNSIDVYKDKNNIIVNMVNIVNSVAFIINVELLDFILTNYKKFNLLIDPEEPHPLSKVTLSYWGGILKIY